MTQPYGQQPTHPQHMPPPHGYPSGPHNAYGHSYGYQPGPPAPPRKSNTGKILLAVLGGLLLLVGGCMALAISRVSSDSPAQQPTASIGSYVKDGNLAFLVSKVERADRVGSRLLGSDAQGKYLLVYVTVTNRGTKPESFAGGSQKLVDSLGREYEPDAGAAIYLKDSNAIYEKINPGNAVNVTLVFDVPPSVTPQTIELHESSFSRGVKVQLTTGGSS